MPEDTGTGREVALTDGVEATTVAGRLPAHVEQTARATREYAEAARAPNTLRAYRSDVEDFSTYCRAELGGADPLPAAPEIVALYITDMAHERRLETSTIERRLASLSGVMGGFVLSGANY